MYVYIYIYTYIHGEYVRQTFITGILMKVSIWLGVPQNRWFIKKNPIEMDDNCSRGNPIYGSPHMEKYSW